MASDWPMWNAAAGLERDDVKLIVQALGNYVEIWVSVRVILDKRSTHHVSNARWRHQKKQAASRPLAKRAEKAVRKLSALPEKASAVPGRCEWARSEIRFMLLRAEQGSVFSDQDGRLASAATAAETDTDWSSE